MAEPKSKNTFYCSFVSIQYIVCECGETFPSEEDLRRHLEEHKAKKEQKEYKCGVCARGFKTEDACVKHYKKSHLYIKDEHDYVSGFVKQEVKEEDEDRSYITVNSEMIQSELTPETEYDQETEFIVQDDSELATIHSEYVDDDSELVENEFVQSVPIEQPKKKSYNSKNIVCEVCGKKYASNAALKYHQRVHTGERPYQCNLCPKRFTMPLFLQIHFRTHTGERPYQCQVCPKAFSSKAALLRHDRVHTGIKPYTCTQCGKSFTQSNSMKLHVNTVHLKLPTPYKSKARRARQRIAQLVRKSETEDTPAEVNDLAETIQFIKQEDFENVEEEVLYEDVDSRSITYEIIYE